jgi:glycosyltransferase involved in cell wall biosynthesis
VLTLAIPNYNGGRFLSETLRSLELNRPYIRWWFQDALSQDDSVLIAERFAGSNDRIIIEPDGGQVDALNRAFRRMEGEIVGFINSDDSLAEGAAKAVLSEFERDPSLDLIYGQVAWLDEGSQITGYHVGKISSLADAVDIYRVWWNGRQWVQPEVFWRRRLWEKVGCFNEKYNFAFDYEYWVRCFQAGAKVKQIPQVLAHFRRHPAQKSRSSDLVANEIRTIVGEVLASEPSLEMNHRKRLERMLSYDLYQAGQDYPAGVGRPSLAHFLIRQPRLALLPPVRQRLVRSVMKTLGGK